MGLGPEPQALLRKLAEKLPPGFSVVELGDQLYATRPAAKRKGKGKRMWEREPAIGFYRTLGCGRYESIDANGNGTVLADLNYPLPDGIGTFDLVTNAGTSEHCFNLAQVWRTIHELAKPSGYIYAEQPSEGYLDHGLVNLQPTFVTDLARDNAYRIEHFERTPTARGVIMRFIYQRTSAAPFRYPTQGRYHRKLRIPC